MVKVKRLRLFLLLSTFFATFLLVQPTAANSNLSEPYQNLFLLVTILSIIVGVGVIAIWVLFILRYRESNTESVRTPISHETARKLEMTWTSVAVLVVILLMIFSYPVLMEVDDDSENLVADADVFVEARQFSFHFFYENFQGNESVILESGLTYRFIVTSVDVIHSFFVPGLHFKIDAVPGTNNTITIELLEEGRYDVWCNEFCGAGHSSMVDSYIEVV